MLEVGLIHEPYGLGRCLSLSLARRMHLILRLRSTRADRPVHPHAAKIDALVASTSSALRSKPCSLPPTIPPLSPDAPDRTRRKERTPIPPPPLPHPPLVLMPRTARSAYRRLLKEPLGELCDGDAIICVGDGATPRTAALFAHLTRGGQCHRVQPIHSSIHLYRIYLPCSLLLSFLSIFVSLFVSVHPVIHVVTLFTPHAAMRHNRDANRHFPPIHLPIHFALFHSQPRASDADRHLARTAVTLSPPNPQPPTLKILGLGDTIANPRP